MRLSAYIGVRSRQNYVELRRDFGEGLTIKIIVGQYGDIRSDLTHAMCRDDDPRADERQQSKDLAYHAGTNCALYDLALESKEIRPSSHILDTCLYMPETWSESTTHSFQARARITSP